MLLNIPSHLNGILTNLEPEKDNFKEIHLWSYQELLNSLPDYPWLYKHRHKFLEKSILFQLYWQLVILKSEVNRFKCSIVLNTDAGTISSINPCVTMSRDMLSYEKGEIERYGLTIKSLRLILLRYIQNRSLRRADGVIFLTKYASSVIQKSCGKVKTLSYIPHGLDKEFHSIKINNNWPKNNSHINILYVSNSALYKHQWHVIEAISKLRDNNKNKNIILNLVGGGSGKPNQIMMNSIAYHDPKREFVYLHSFLSRSDVISKLKEADIFIFASSCENMPNTLLEAMAAGLPIASSFRGPMPEILLDGGIYFNPEQPDTIRDAVQSLISDQNLRDRLRSRAKQISFKYSWQKTAQKTLLFLNSIVANY